MNIAAVKPSYEELERINAEAEESIQSLAVSFAYEQELCGVHMRQLNDLRESFRPAFERFKALFNLMLQVDLAEYGYEQRRQDAKLIKTLEAQL